METEKVGMREFRENLAGYLEAGRTLAITRHGETLGFFIPARKESRKAEVEAMRAAAKELDDIIVPGVRPRTNTSRSTRRSARPAARRSGMPGKALVLDTNILIRAVLDQRVRRILLRGSRVPMGMRDAPHWQPVPEQRLLLKNGMTKFWNRTATALVWVPGYISKEFATP